MEDMPKSDFKYELYGWHKSFGVLVIILFFMRVISKIASKLPAHHPALPKRDIVLAKLGHFALYVLMFAVPLSGFIMSQAGGHPVAFFGLPIPEIFSTNKELGGIAHELHEILPYLLAGIISIHILAVVKHHVVEKVNLLKRMF